MVSLYSHQTDCLNNVIDEITKGNGKAAGRIVIPTGGGKTFIEAAIQQWQQNNNSKTKIHLVLAPRIILTNQLIKNYREFSGQKAYRVIAFHSGNYEPDYEVIAWKEKSTTSYNEVLLAYDNAKKCNMDLIVFSTYHSCNKLSNIVFDTLIADESQYCVNEDFNNDIQNIKANVRLFFTATEKHTASNNGRGLNNETVFGKRLYSISPSELISLGLIVPPRLHIMYGESTSEEDSIVSEVIELATMQNSLTANRLNFSKILFAMKGTADVKTIEDNISKIQSVLPTHDIFTITSKLGPKINGVSIRKEDFLKELTERKNCLIFHYDILSEGIDVDGITGVCLMRNLSLSKLIQTIGRAVRIYKPDPTLKTEAWISVPAINGNEDDKARVKMYVHAIRAGGFDISVDDIIITGNDRHQADDDNVDDAYNKTKNNYSDLFVEQIFHEIEDTDFWDDMEKTKTVEEKIDLLFNAVFENEA